MQAFALTETLVFMVVGFLVGARILWLARRTRGFSEFSLGLALFLIVGVGYPLVLAGTLAGREADGLAIRALQSGGLAVMTFGWCAIVAFTWRVFRRDAGWASVLGCGLIGALLLVLAIRVVENFQAPTAASTPRGGLAGQETLVLALVAYAWTAFEGFRYWRLLRRRMAMGLADAVVANRVLLWALVGVFSFVSVFPSVVFALLGRATTLDPISQLFSATAGMVCALLLYLAFLPPRRYLAWVKAQAA